MKYEVKFTSQFKKDLKLAKKQNKDLDKLFEVIDILANGGTLEEKYKDHGLTGNYKGTRECHIEPDWLLIYEIKNSVLVLLVNKNLDADKKMAAFAQLKAMRESITEDIDYEKEREEAMNEKYGMWKRRKNKKVPTHEDED